MSLASERAGERALIQSLSAVLGGGAGAGVSVGIGDDAACLRWPGGDLVVSVDAQIEGTHFKLAWLSLSDVGFRSFQAAISDLAAMGATPVAAVSHLTLPPGFSRAQIRQLVGGQAVAAQEHCCPVVGGNLGRGPELSVVTTVIGRTRRPVLRTGARVGDLVWVIGELGLARAGFELLSRASAPALLPKSAAARQAIRAWRRPHAQVASGLSLGRHAHAAVDVSDGLAGDAQNLALASGVELVIEADRLLAALSPALVRVADDLGLSPVGLALSGGEDYALLATGAAKRRPADARVIGYVARGSHAWLDTRGTRTRVGASFDHFSG